MTGDIRSALAGVLLFLGLLAGVGSAVAADGVVGPGNCNEAGFDAVLASVDGSGGGTITFNCGSAVIAFTAYKQVANTVTIDGGGTITFDGGNASAFFQIFASSQTTLRRLTLRRGVFQSGVHALENFGTLVLDRMRVIDNVSSGSPVANYRRLVVDRSTFSGNSATASASGDGGAILHSGNELRISKSTFSGNSAGRYGGAIYSVGALTLSNSTFTANTAGLGGGAIYQAGIGAASVEFATIVGNSASFGAGLYNDGGGGSSLLIGRSIVAANSTGNCDGVLTSSGYNLSNGSDCGSGFTNTGDLINQTLPMGSLADNGGVTLTLLPLAGNPAIDHVPFSQCTLAADQRDSGRPTGGGCESGSVEVDAPTFRDGFE